MSPPSLNVEDYQFASPEPFAHQRADFLATADKQVLAIGHEMGCGKSRILVDTVAYQFLAGKIDSLLFVAPKGCYANIVSEFRLWWSLPQAPVFHVWTGKKTKAEAFELDRMLDPERSDGIRIFVVNIEALKVKRNSQRKVSSTSRGYDYCMEFLSSGRAMMAVDESTCIKSSTAQQTLAAFMLGRRAVARRIMTGTPLERPADLYTQTSFLEPGILGHKVESTFVARYCKISKISIRGGQQAQVTHLHEGALRNTLAQLASGASEVWMTVGGRKLRVTDSGRNIHAIQQALSVLGREPIWLQLDREVEKVSGFQNLDELKQALDTFMIRRLKRDCLDLPPKIYLRRDVEMTPEQAKMSKSLRESARAELAKLGATMTAKDILTQVLRLHQIELGTFVDSSSGESHEIPENRTAALMQALQECGKAVIFVPFRDPLKRIYAKLLLEYGNESIVRYFGDTKPDERTAAIDRFQNDPACKIFIGNVQTAGFGLTLNAAHTMFYVGNTQRLIERQQSEDRCHRAGQNYPVTITDFIVRGGVSERIVNALRAKRDLAATVLDDDLDDWIPA